MIIVIVIKQIIELLQEVNLNTHNIDHFRQKMIILHTNPSQAIITM
jgi:hypothetical protein